MGLERGMTLIFYSSVVKRLKLKVRYLGRPIPNFPEVAGEKLIGSCYVHTPPPNHTENS